MDSIDQEIRSYYGNPEPTAYLPGYFYNDEGPMPPSPDQHNISSISQLSEADYAPPTSFNQTPSSPSYFSVSFLLDDSHDQTASPTYVIPWSLNDTASPDQSPQPLSQPDPPVQHIPINAQLHSPVHELLHQSP